MENVKSFNLRQQIHNLEHLELFKEFALVDLMSFSRPVLMFEQVEEILQGKYNGS